ncbi:MAG: IS1595 family transposase [Planctomycetota bacterium]
MAKQYEARGLLDFQRAFAGEEACWDHLNRIRWPDGFVCPRCGHDKAWFIRTRKVMDSKTSVTAGTIFHKTRTPLLKWYWLLYRMATNKVGTSVAEMQRLLDIRDYKTAWLMAHKVRKAMSDRDAHYTPAGLVELDESFFGPAGQTPGRGSECKSTVLCAVSLYLDAKGRQRPGFAHLQVVKDASAKSIEGFLDRLGCGAGTAEGRQLLETIRTDGWRSYEKAARKKNLAHCRVVLRQPSDTGRLLSWVHRVISNAKAVLRGTHRGVSEKHLQAYLGEVCYRFNRRFWGKELFDRLIRACASTGTVTYSQLLGRKAPVMS